MLDGTTDSHFPGNRKVVLLKGCFVLRFVLFSVLCMHLCLSIHIISVCTGSLGGFGSPGLESQAIVSCLMYVLESALGSSERAVSALNS